MGDKRTDPGHYYPGGRVRAKSGTAPQELIVQWSDVQGKPQIAPLPDRYRESDMKGKINEIASKFATVVLAALIGWTAVADITVQKKRKDMIYNDEQVVVDVTGSGVGVDTNAVERIANKAVETNAVTVGLSSSVSGLQSSKLDGPTDPNLALSGKAADAKSTGDALAGKASRSEVKLVPVYSDWIFSDGKPHYLRLEYIDFENPYWTYLIDGLLADECTTFDSKEDAEVALSLEFHHYSGEEPIDTTATRSIVAYKLGEQTPQLFSKSAVIDPASATTTGKAADALKVKAALAGKQPYLGATNDGYTVVMPENRSLAVQGSLYVTANASISGSLSANHITVNGTDVALTSDISETNPAFSNAVLAVGIDTNVLAAVAASTNAVAQIGEFYAAFSDIGLTPTQGGMTIAGLLAALVAAVTWLKKTFGKVADNSGEPTDDFATDLLEKQVAKEAIAYKVATTAGENRSVLVVEIAETATAAVNVIVPAPVANKVIDFEVWVKVAARSTDIPQINYGYMVDETFTPVTLIKKGGENPAYEKDASATVTNIVHFTSSDASGYTVVAAAFK